MLRVICSGLMDRSLGASLSEVIDHDMGNHKLLQHLTHDQIPWRKKDTREATAHEGTPGLTWPTSKPLLKPGSSMNDGVICGERGPGDSRLLQLGQQSPRRMQERAADESHVKGEMKNRCHQEARGDVWQREQEQKVRDETHRRPSKITQAVCRRDDDG